MTQSTPRAGPEPRAAGKPLGSEAKPKRGPEHERLAVFTGDWRGEGAGAEGSKMTTRESYDWVEGKFFLVTNFDQKVGGASHIGVGLMGYDPEAQTYFLNMADNLGYARAYEVRDLGRDVWRFLGERERATLTLQGDRMNVRWEHRPDGGDWAPLCEFNAVNERKTRAH
jgi:hypothetical protein